MENLIPAGLDQDTFIKQLLAERQAVQEQLAEYKLKEKIEAENRELRESIRKEPRAGSIRNTLVLRRTSDHDKMAPARDILAYLDLYDQKEAAKTGSKKTRVSDTEINVYHDLKAQGITDITPKMVKDIVEGKGGTVDANDDDAEHDTDQALETEVVH